MRPGDNALEEGAVGAGNVPDLGDRFEDLGDGCAVGAAVVLAAELGAVYARGMRLAGVDQRRVVLRGFGVHGVPPVVGLAWYSPWIRRP